MSNGFPPVLSIIACIMSIGITVIEAYADAPNVGVLVMGGVLSGAWLSNVWSRWA